MSGGAPRSRSGTWRPRIAGSCPAATSATRGSTRWASSPPTSPTRTTSWSRPASGGPDWHVESVVYQVFPDRFASSGARRHAAEWAIPRDWDELPTGRGPETPFEWFGGDLGGIEERLDHLTSLGVNVLYLTPVFPARSTHRYDATSFESVDPLLGGDDALASLVRAAHAKGIRVLGDLTTNHVGSGHEWFLAAQAAP